MDSSTPVPNLKDYSLTEKLGIGTYGVVYKARLKSGFRDVVAVKCMRKSGLRKFEQDLVVMEIKLLKELRHDHIVQMKDFLWDNNFIYIIMEYCGGGDLSNFIKSRKTLSENTCQGFLQQLASALKFLRTKNIAHLDLKPQNILLILHPPPGYRFRGPSLKLADFGFAQTLSLDQTQTSPRGSPLYMAPEMVLDRKYDAKVDLWSVGVILFECLFGRAPYKSASTEELQNKMREDKPIEIPLNVGLSDSCSDLLARCLQRDPARRIDFQDFFNHPFPDLEHMPSDESESKAVALSAQAKAYRQRGDPDSALTSYRAALEYFVPLFKYERTASGKERLRQSIKEVIVALEALKGVVRVLPEDVPKIEKEAAVSLRTCRTFGTGAGSSVSRVAGLASRTSTSQGVCMQEELFKLAVGTPQLRAGLEIIQAAESYHLEGQYKVALEKYESGLGLLIPLMKTEPQGRRKFLLAAELKRCMSQAEDVKEILSVQHPVSVESLANASISDGLSDMCHLQ